MYQADLPLFDASAAQEAQARTELDWFHRIQLGGFLTPGFGFEENWTFVADFLQKHEGVFRDASVLEPGCADGLWTSWFAKLGAHEIVATDIADRDQFRLVSRAFDLPVTYFPGILSTLLPKYVRRKFDIVATGNLAFELLPVLPPSMHRPDGQGAAQHQHAMFGIVP